MTKATLNKTNWRGRIIRYAPLILWIGIIFFASTTAASMSNTSRFIGPLLEFLFPDTSEEILLIYHGYIRKSAHFVQYAALAFWALLAFCTSSIKFLRKYQYAAALILVAAVASLDETGQSFTPTRTGSIYDVLLDITGGLFMIFLFILFKFFWRKYNKNNMFDK